MEEVNVRVMLWRRKRFRGVGWSSLLRDCNFHEMNKVSKNSFWS